MIKAIFCCLTASLLLMAGCSNENPTASLASSKKAAAPIEVKVVVVTMFELGEVSGDEAGEFQRWKERHKLDQRFPFPQSHADLYLNPESGVLGMITGMGTNRSSSAIMALGLDPRFDLTKAYWLVAGISGFDPNDAPIGSAAWAEWLVDGDLGHAIDAREIPQDWETGFFPLFTAGPYPDKRPPNQGEVFQLNGKLTEWAYQLTKDVELSDDDFINAQRKNYGIYPNAQKKPVVMKGDHMAAMTFWHGEYFNQWANKYVDYWTEGQGQFVSSAMEDTGTAQSLFYLDRSGKADYQRLMVVRTASNFTVPEPGMTAAQNLLNSEGHTYAGMELALENAWRIGSKVVDTLTSNWSVYRNNMPYEQ